MRSSGIGPGWGLALALTGIVTLVALGSWLLLPDIVTQGQQLVDQLPRGWDELRQRLSGIFGNAGMIDYAFDRVASPSRGAMQDIVGGVFGVVSGTLGFIGSGLVILFTGIYLAADPNTYRAGLIRLVPPAHRDRARRIVDEIDRVLLWWLVGKLIGMALIGVLTYLGLWALGMPLALSLALIAAFLTFVPNFGPIIAAAPAILIALGDGLNQAALVVLLYVLGSGGRKLSRHASDPAAHHLDAAGSDADDAARSRRAAGHHGVGAGHTLDRRGYRSGPRALRQRPA